MTCTETAKGKETRRSYNEKKSGPKFIEEISKERKRLPEKYKYVMDMTYQAGVTQIYLAETMNIDERQLRQLIREVKIFMFGALKL
jgi:DNA-directed RNA polymerase specialized sigma subunit